MVDFMNDTFDVAFHKILEQVDKFVDLKSFGIELKTGESLEDSLLAKKRQSNRTVNSNISDFNQTS